MQSYSHVLASPGPRKRFTVGGIVRFKIEQSTLE